MLPVRPTSLSLASGLQLCAATLALLVLPLWPPASGPMLLIPLTPGAQRTMISVAVGQGALLVGRGPLPGSYVVYGERGRLLGSLIGAGVAVLASRPAGCGAERARAA